MSKLGRHDPDDDPEGGDELKPRLAFFRRPKDAYGPTARTSFVPLTLAALRREAVKFFPLPQHYHLMLAYEILPTGSSVENVVLLNEEDMDRFHQMLAAGYLPTPLSFIVEWVKFNPATGEVSHRKLAATSPVDGSALGCPINLDHPGVRKYQHLKRVKKIEMETTNVDDGPGADDDEPGQGTGEGVGANAGEPDLNDLHAGDDHGDAGQTQGNATLDADEDDELPMDPASGSQSQSQSQPMDHEPVHNFGLRKGSRFGKGSKKRCLESST
ncbi:hypothetical protein V8E36_004331 [Tilletia maclaganii]